MKKLSFFEKIIFFINSVAAFVLLLSYILPFLPPKTFSVLSVLSLGVPILIVVNTLFVLYWMLKVQQQMLLSLIILLIGYFSFGSLYKFSESKAIVHENNIKIMNYNVRLFNLYDWIKVDNIETKIVDFIKSESPDVLSLQEYHPLKNEALSFFKYKYENLSGKHVKNGQAIFSKFPIINSGSIAFPNTSNNAIYVDIIKSTDTIRVYNIHLQSLHIDADVEKLAKEDSEKLFKGVGRTFTMQQFQTELFLLHKRECKYKMVVCGDFNNTAFSYVYKEIKSDLIDTFKAAGNGFGRTFNFKLFPMRIDFILTHKAFHVNGFKTYDVEYSDHFPISATISL